MIDQLRPRGDELVPGSQHLQMLLRDERPVLNRIQQRPIGAPSVAFAHPIGYFLPIG